MSALPLKADMLVVGINVQRFACPLSAMSGHLQK